MPDGDPRILGGEGPGIAEFFLVGLIFFPNFSFSAPALDLFSNFRKSWERATEAATAVKAAVEAGKKQRLEAATAAKLRGEPFAECQGSHRGHTLTLGVGLEGIT